MTPTPEVDVAAMRREYARIGLDEAGLEATWLDQFDRWLREAITADVSEPNAMILATADAAGHPSARTVLLKGVDGRGFVFFTNLTSRKAIEAATNPYASLVFPWHAVGRQVVVCGRIAPVERAATEAYFASRPRESQLGAWASPQSQVVADREVLDRAVDEAGRRFPGEQPPAPPYWGGLRVTPDTVEFWQGRIGRLHDRLRFRRRGGVEAGLTPGADFGGNAGGDIGEAWVVERLAP